MSDQKPLGGAEREALARELVDEKLDITPAVDRPTAILTAGQPGSGKGSITNKVAVAFEESGSPAVTIDADKVRPDIPYMRGRIAKGDLDIPDAANADAGTVAARMMQMAAEARRNIVYDGTLSNTGYAKANVDYLKAQGYRVEVHGMAVAPDLSHASTYDRREGEIASSPTKFGRSVGDAFHAQSVEGLVKTIEALQADGKVDAIVLHDRQGKVVGSVTQENGQWTSDDNMADLLRRTHAQPDQRTLRDAAKTWDRASDLMRGRGADTDEQRKVDSFRDAAVARATAITASSADRAVQFEKACADESKSIVARATQLDRKLQDHAGTLRKEADALTRAKPSRPGWMPGAAKALETWEAHRNANTDAIATAVARIERIAPFTKPPIDGFPSAVEEAAIRNVERRDPKLAKEAIAYRADERVQRAQAFSESRAQQQGQTHKLRQ